MTAGVSATRANTWLGELSGLSMALHTGDPGSAGTSNASAETSKKTLTLAAASGGSRSMSGTAPTWTTWTAGSETLTHASVWSSSGTVFEYSFAFTASKSVSNGDNVSLATHSVSVTPVAA